MQIGNARPMRRDAIGPCNNMSRPANRASPALRIVDLLRSILETGLSSANAAGVTEPAGAGATSPYSPSGIVDFFTGSGLQQCREPRSVVIVAARRHPLRGQRADLLCYAVTGSVRSAVTVCRRFSTGLILNQIAYS